MYIRYRNTKKEVVVREEIKDSLDRWAVRKPRLIALTDRQGGFTIGKVSDMPLAVVTPLNGQQEVKVRILLCGAEQQGSLSDCLAWAESYLRPRCAQRSI